MLHIHVYITNIRTKVIITGVRKKLFWKLTIPPCYNSTNELAACLFSDGNSASQVYLEVASWPPGFSLSGGICNCMNSIGELVTCNICNQSIVRKGNSWIHPRNDSVLIFEACPFDYCNRNAFVRSEPDQQCSVILVGVESFAANVFQDISYSTRFE